MSAGQKRAERSMWAKAATALGALRNASSGSMAVVQTLLVRVLVLSINLLTGIITARVLGPEGRAEQAAMLIGIGLFPAVLSFGLPMAIQYRLRTEPERQERFVSAATFLSVAFGALAIVVSFFVLPRLITKYSPSVLHVAQIFMLSAPFVILYLMFCAVLQARGDFAKANFTRYAVPLSTLLGLIGLAIAHRFTPLTSSIAYVLPSLWATPWLWVRVRPKLTFRDLKQTASGLLSYGSRSYATDILSTLSGQIDQVLVIALLSPKSMGLYAVAISAARASDLVSAPLVTVLFPKASGLPARQIVELTARAARLTLALLIPALLASLAAMPFVLPALYGKSYSGATPLAQILALSFLVGGTVYVLNQAFAAAGKPGVVAVVELLGLAGTVPLMFLLIPRFGLPGAAWAIVASITARLFVTLACFPIVLKEPMPSLIVTRGDLRFLYTTLKARLSGKPSAASAPV
jgi:O-antigen/teichoic acid export membrane protein